MKAEYLPSIHKPSSDPAPSFSTFLKVFWETRARSNIEEIKSKIAQQFSPKRIYLFGSYAYGTPTAESDLDLLIVDDSENDQAAHRKGVAISQALFPRDYGLDLMVYSESKFNQYFHLLIFYTS